MQLVYEKAQKYNENGYKLTSVICRQFHALQNWGICIENPRKISWPVPGRRKCCSVFSYLQRSARPGGCLLIRRQIAVIPVRTGLPTVLPGTTAICQQKPAVSFYRKMYSR